MSHLYHRDDAGNLRNAYCCIPQDGVLAICFALDDGPVGGTLHKHGEATLLRQWRGAQWAQFMLASLQTADAGLKEFYRRMAAEFRIVEIKGADVTPAILEEINACLETSGRVAKLEARLTELLAA